MPRLARLPVSMLRGSAALATDATLGVTDVVEAMHLAVWRTLGLQGDGRGGTRGITGAVYRGVRAVTRGAGALLQNGLHAFETADANDPQTAVALRAIVNGVLGDALAARGNPLALPMTLLFRGEPLHAPPAGVSDRVVVLVHGLCMHDRQWSPGDADGTDLGRELEARGHTVVHVRYNSGLPIAHNGCELSAQLDRLRARWPVPIDALSLVGHSMGGLVIRAAIADAERRSARWRAGLRAIACLGTPHLGAPLERLGHGLERLLAQTRYSAPLVAIGGVRSAGILDLRHGATADPAVADGRRCALPPLPDDVACLAIAATLSSRRSAVAERLLGDGLVPLASALGHHPDPRRRLQFDMTHVLPGTGHVAMIHSAITARHVVDWLQAHASPAKPRAR